MINEMKLKLSVARIYFPVKVLGPGNRVGIWLNGCSKKCEECISPELQEYDLQKELTIEMIIEMLKSIPNHIDGFTISGGEPFYCPESLSALVESLSTINDDILIFTGYTIEELKSQNRKAIDTVINKCSALIDGPYIKKQNDCKGLRGSANQRCWIFKHYDKYENIEIVERQLQTIIYGENILTIGIPQGDLL